MNAANVTLLKTHTPLSEDAVLAAIRINRCTRGIGINYVRVYTWYTPVQACVLDFIA